MINYVYKIYDPVLRKYNIDSEIGHVFTLDEKYVIKFMSYGDFIKKYNDIILNEQEYSTILKSIVNSIKKTDYHVFISNLILILTRDVSIEKFNDLKSQYIMKFDEMITYHTDGGEVFTDLTYSSLRDYKIKHDFAKKLFR